MIDSASLALPTLASAPLRLLSASQSLAVSLADLSISLASHTTCLVGVSLTDFAGGGTVLRHSPPLSVPSGWALLFCGQQQHGAAATTSGKRLVLTGVIDLRAPWHVRNTLANQMTTFDPD